MTQHNDLGKTENGQPQEPEPSQDATMFAIEAALYLAVGAHRALRDKQGRPAILHVLRVVNAVPFGEAQIVAALHDVIEDTGVTMWDLRHYSERVQAAVEAITRRKDEVYADYIARLSTNELARAVKIADLRDNIARGGAFPSLLERYHRALAKLGEGEVCA